MTLPFRAALVAACLVVLGAAAARAEDPESVVMSHDPEKYGIVVSATRTPRDNLELPDAAVVVRGDELKRTGARTLADALIDVVGVEAGGGTDNGSLLTNIGMWGLREFDALLVTVDGVPVGGPFNPSLAQIPIDDIERIEIVKGPQGSMYGISAFAGMVQVFTGRQQYEGVSGWIGGGSFGRLDGRVNMRNSGDGMTLDASLSGAGDDGWQDRTASGRMHGRASLSGSVGGTHLSLSVDGIADRQDWGTPVPVADGVPLPGFENPDRNQAVGGAVMEHRLWTLSLNASAPVGPVTGLRNTVSLTRDHQRSVRSFVSGVNGTDVSSAGVAIEPVEYTVYEDLGLVSRFQALGKHEFVTGAAITYGHTSASGIGFDFDQVLNDPASIPYWGAVPVGDHRAFDDRRTFFGVYAHDSWTPVRAFTLSGGGRWDRARETLHAYGQETGFAAVVSDDSREDSAWSGDLAGLVRLLPEKGAGPLGALNAYANWKSSFKPAAPNLTEAEDARILDPEHSHSVEAGLKGRAFEGQLAFEASAFQLDFHNIVVGVLNANGDPALTNAGHERFKGFEVSAVLTPASYPGWTLSAGYAHHDPRFVEFTFLTPDGQLRNVSGNQVELAPREMWNAKVTYAPILWLGAWAAVRHQGERPLSRRNTSWTPGFEEYDAGVTLELMAASASFTARNLGDSRHDVSESDIGDSQFYVAPPRRYTFQISISI